jgi:hypothetical protein
MKKFLLTLLLALSLLLTSCASQVPYIGENGNWWVGDEDLGVSAQGPQGEKGDTGKKGDEGPKGDKGDKGQKGDVGDPVKVSSVKKTSSNNGVDTYKITFSDGTYTTFKVTNGQDGDSPYVGENGNWWVGDTDTNVKAEFENMDRIGTDGLIFRTTIRGGVAGYEVCGYTGTDTNIIIPSYIFNQPVVSIMQDALPSRITSVSISSNTEWLPEFDGYTNLVSFDFNGAPVDTLQNEMFDGCNNLKTISNYENLKILGNRAFYDTALTEFDFSHITHIGTEAFKSCDYLSEEEVLISGAPFFIYLPPNVVSVGQHAFGEILVYFSHQLTTTITSDDDFDFGNVKHSADGYYYIDNGTYISLLNYDGDETRLTLPKKIDNKPVTTLENLAFVGNPWIERIEIPNSVTTIGAETFFGCKKLHSIFIPDSVVTCGDFVSDIDDLLLCGFEFPTFFFESNTIDYTGGITSPEQLDIARYMLAVDPSDIVDDDTCVYLKKTLSYEVVSIKNKAGLVTIPATYNLLPVTRINTFALLYAITTAVEIEDGIEKIAAQAFYGSPNLKYINVPNSVDVVNQYGFYDLDDCVIYIEHKSIPEDWDSNWYYNIDSYVLNAHANLNQTGDYLYETVDGKVYLAQYLKEVKPGTPIFIPEKIDGKAVYGIREKCFYAKTASDSSSDRYIFVMPDSITVMEYQAIYLYYGYAYVYLEFASSSDIPSTWNSSWIYNYHYSSYITKYYSGSWELVNGVPVLKQ